MLARKVSPGRKPGKKVSISRIRCSAHESCSAMLSAYNILDDSNHRHSSDDWNQKLERLVPRMNFSELPLDFSLHCEIGSAKRSASKTIFNDHTRYPASSRNNPGWQVCWSSRWRRKGSRRKSCRRGWKMVEVFLVEIRVLSLDGGRFKGGGLI